MFLRALLSLSTTAATKIETKRASCNQQENKNDLFKATLMFFAVFTLSDFLKIIGSNKSPQIDIRFSCGLYIVAKLN